MLWPCGTPSLAVVHREVFRLKLYCIPLFTVLWNAVICVNDIYTKCFLCIQLMEESAARKLPHFCSLEIVGAGRFKFKQLRRFLCTNPNLMKEWVSFLCKRQLLSFSPWPLLELLYHLWLFFFLRLDFIRNETISGRLKCQRKNSSLLLYFIEVISLAALLKLEIGKSNRNHVNITRSCPLPNLRFCAYCAKGKDLFQCQWGM